MYWYNLNRYFKILPACICLLYLGGCKPEVRQNGRPAYFNLKQYFAAEATRLGKEQKPVLKTVNYNNQPENKTLVIKNWQRELALFNESDINKPSWRNSYQEIAGKDSTIYRAIDTNLRTRYIAIIQKADKVSAIHITNVTRNLLYQTTEKLSYYPDSLYEIDKHQAVRILGVHNYMIKGVFKR